MFPDREHKSLQAGNDMACGLFYAHLHRLCVNGQKIQECMKFFLTYGANRV
jgi:hypothetical protein